MMRLFLVLVVVLFLGVGLAAAQEATVEPSPTLIPTATPTATFTPDIFVYSTVVAPGQAVGQPVAVVFQVTAGEALIAVLLFALFSLELLRLVLKK